MARGVLFRVGTMQLWLFSGEPIPSIPLSWHKEAMSKTCQEYTNVCNISEMMTHPMNHSVAEISVFFPLPKAHECWWNQSFRSKQCRRCWNISSTPNPKYAKGAGSGREQQVYYDECSQHSRYQFHPISTSCGYHEATVGSEQAWILVIFSIGESMWVPEKALPGEINIDCSCPTSLKNPDFLVFKIKSHKSHH